MSEADKPAQQPKRQTGPKTAAGKRTSAGNASKHGLSAKKFKVNSAADRIGKLASALAAKFPSQSSAEEHIQQAAESQHHIEQVRTLKAEVIAKALFDGALSSPGGASGAPLTTASLDWQRLERYE